MDDGPVILEGQIVGEAAGTPDGSAAGARIDAGELGLPTSERAIVSYLTNSYGGVGKMTAEALVEAFGPNIFAVFENEPGRVAEIVPRRAPQVLAEWKADFERRSGKSPNDREKASQPDGGAEPSLARESVGVTPGSGAESESPPSLFSTSAPVPDSSNSAPVPDSSASAPVPDSSASTPVPDSSTSAPVPDSSSSSSPLPRSGGARRRTRRSPRRPPSSGSDD